MSRPIRVTAHLLNGVSYVPGEIVSLDGPLLYAVMIERLGADFAADPPSKDALAKETAEPDPRIPLAVHHAGRRWIYAVGGAEIDAHHGSTLTHWNKRVDDGALAMAVQDETVDMGRSSRVNISSAQYKSYHMPIYDELVERLHWYALTTDADELRRLLTTHVHHVGKKRNAGHGVVMSWEVEPVDAQPDRWMRRPDGSLTRPIPLAMLPTHGSPTEVAPVRPPYWLMQHEEECAI